jgi:hypothetical protein
MFLWPLATYSGGFGQHMNTHTWFLIGVGLAALSQTNDLLPKRIKILRAR